MSHHRVWKFKPPTGRETEFEQAYSGSGDWVELFRNAAGYQGTTLLRPSEPDGWWLTIDRWDSAADFDAFIEEFGEEYRVLDAKLEGVAGEEQFVGTFED
jgi:heme-degrading monooxygenase HmoA